MATIYNIIGVMSGTSLDGIDLAYIQFKYDLGKWDFEIYEAETVAYSNEWVQLLKEAVNLSSEKLTQLNKNYTNLLAKTINNFIIKNQINSIDAVCSHGHTILHQPQNGFTLQIGNLPEIATLINQNVVCDFRVQDVAMGGQGAPLVPIGDKILFYDYKYCLNLGGFSNISFDEGENRIAFDISPVNTVLNFYAHKRGVNYDEGGKISAKGNINETMFNALNQLDYYKKTPPKSLGIEYVNTFVIPLIEQFDISIEDKLRTFVEHISTQINNALPFKKGKMLITGGGAYNTFLIENMKKQLKEIEVIIPHPKIIEFKEALIFGLLGVLKLRNEINVLASVTGASYNHSSGIIYNK